MEIKPEAIAMPTDTDQLEQGKYELMVPKSPACHGFTFIAKIIPGCGPALYRYVKNIEEAVTGHPNSRVSSKLHSLSWVLLPIHGDTYFMYQCTFDTDFGKYTEEAMDLLVRPSLGPGFENLEGFPEDSRSRRSSGWRRQVTSFRLSETLIPTHSWFSDWIISFQIRRPRTRKSAL